MASPLKTAIVSDFNDAWNERLWQLLSIGDEAEALFCEGIKKEPRPTEFRDLYVIVMALQAIGHFRSARVLIKGGRDQEVRIILRSLTELIIRIRWCYCRRSNAVWLILGDEAKQRNRIFSHKHRLAKRAAQFMDRNLAAAKKDKRARYWDRQKNRVRPLIDTKQMAKEARLIRLYNTYFFITSQATHGYHAELQRFLAFANDSEWRGFILDPLPVELQETARRTNWLFGLLLAILRENGADFDERRIESILSRSANLKGEG